MLIRRPSRTRSGSLGAAPAGPAGSRRHRAIGAAAALLLTALAVQLPQQGSAVAADSGPAAESEPLCGTPQPGHFGCFAVRQSDATGGRGARSAGPEGFGPADLRSAYSLPADGGAGATIAVVAAYDNPNAEQDLAAYRAQYGLPPCTSETGCLRKVDQRGGTDYPQPNDGWAGEISLDLDMVSAVAPKAHILLVEADSSATDDLGAAVNTAVAMGARYVSNSYGAYYDGPDLAALDAAYFDHPGTAVVFASGDYGHGLSYPASSPYVTSVGGTSLSRSDAGARGWTETVWSGTGSGCSAYQPKPSFQTGTGCDRRSVADVSAVADPETGVAVYNTYSGGGWGVYGGTSASAPIIAGLYALAGTPVDGTYPAAYPYRSPGALNDVTTGSNAHCSDDAPCDPDGPPACEPANSCTAGPGYDGPTGLGTPKGVGAFRPGPHGTVTGKVTDKATGKALSGATVRLGAHSAVTGADGRWSLAAPTGTYTLTVDAFGYARKNLGETTLADGAELTRNAALSAVPTATVSGTVRDGGGHGWGLYARLTVDGVPGTVHTDPRTGRYSVRLERGRTYTLRATGLYPGYRPAETKVELGSSSRTADLALPLVGTGALPPGYAVEYGGGGFQSFDTAAKPAGWSIVNHTDAGGWGFDDPLTRGNQTGGDGGFAQVDDYALGWGEVDTELISPEYDLSKETRPTLEFDTALPSLWRFNDPTADIDVSTDGGDHWENLWHHTDVVEGPSHQTVALTAYAGKPSVRLRFHFAGSLTGIWQLDNVAVGTRSLVTVPGGLLTGRVTDANTGAGVVGATVSAAKTPQDSGRSIASPDDPAVGDGLYWAFSSRTGRQEFTAGLPAFGYPAGTSTVKVEADAVTSADFALRPSRLKASPGAVGVTVPWGGKKTVTVKVRNTGGAPASLTVGEQAVALTSARMPGAPRERTAARPDPLDVATATAAAPGGAAGATGGEAWQPLADLPQPMTGGIAAANDGVLYSGLGQTPDGQWTTALRSYDRATATWKDLAPAITKRSGAAYGFVRGKLYVVGGKNRAGTPIAGGEVYDPATDTWSRIADAPKAYGNSAAAAVGDRLYVVGGCTSVSCGTRDVQVYDPAGDTWSTGPAYPVPTSWQSCGTVDGTLYCAGGVHQGDGQPPHATAAGYALDRAAGRWTPIADPPVDFWGAATAVGAGRLMAAGGVLVGAAAVTNEAYAYDPAADTWSALPNLPQPLYAAAGAPGWSVVGGQSADRVMQTSALELPGYDAPHGDVAWLAGRASSSSVGAGRTAELTVTVDARAMGPADAGAHRARLVVDSDGPYASVTVPVTMTVVAPPGWTRLSGTVSGSGRHGGTTPLAGATVRVGSGAGAHTLSTAADGTYRLWLPPSGGGVPLAVSAEGYRSAERTVRPRGRDAVTVDVVLTRR
ncbi:MULTISPECIES: carboxypeptidase regulatory-like domain-containing protein [unclassified Streptomyces]|uniref:carboxypeptidase regulatory-like domain-containing protein n=1 Tax=unclassified Streptomyces TaxID=2593676 RepID=UPI0003740B44|nr:carboxypeptidase regulatory-like domain-containing protein [Streptomyces sp. BoleA5]MYX39450.1 galactose oxidase [Streptomyces sp. SID8377]